MIEQSAVAIAESDLHSFEQLSELLDAIERHPDDEFRERVMELVRFVIAMHRGAFHRIIDILATGPDGEEIISEITSDQHVQAVLMVQGLLPADLETRVLEGLDLARESLQGHGADVELVSLGNGVARLRLIGSQASANVSTATLKMTIERALYEAAPDLARIEYEGTIAAAKPQRMVQITPRSALPERAKGNWIPIIRAQEVPDSSLRVVAVGDVNLLLCNVAGTIYAMRNACAHRGLSLEGAMLEGFVLTCPWHGYQYDLRQGGRCLNDPAVKLEQLPVNVEGGIVRVSL
jgi:nitrite reductase/ring-hydroxylating ferredoxin subunit/Fe-S cluster biogenesis protein NfuA